MRDVAAAHCLSLVAGQAWGRWGWGGGALLGAPPTCAFGALMPSVPMPRAA